MNAITVSSIQVYSDASGCPAVISCGSYVYAFDMLGEIKQNLLKPVYGSRKESKIASSRCLAAYKKELAKHVDAEWLARNATLYAT